MSGLFSGECFKPVQPDPVVISIPKREVPREKRLLFVGNVSLSTKKRELVSRMSEFGRVEKAWMRSVPVSRGKLPIKAAVALEMYTEGLDTCNYYVLFEEESSAQEALSCNGEVMGGYHLRVDWANSKEKNHENSVFIGNLAYDTTDEELWNEFQEFGDIQYVRIIRDKDTHIGKGFAYVCFKKKSSAKKALAKNMCLFKERKLRVKKAEENSSVKQPSNKKEFKGVKHDELPAKRQRSKNKPSKKKDN